MKRLLVSASVAFLLGLALAPVQRAHAGVSVIPSPEARPVQPVQPTQNLAPSQGSQVISPSSPDAPVQEVMEQRRQMQESMEIINQLNPLGQTQLAPGEETQRYEQALQNPSGFIKQNEQALRRLQRLMEMPTFQSYVRLIRNPNVTESLEALLDHPKKKTFFVLTGILFVGLLIFRAWRNSKTTHWFQRVWINAYSLIGFWAIAFIGVPWFIFGEPYQTLLREIVRTLRG